MLKVVKIGLFFWVFLIYAAFAAPVAVNRNEAELWANTKGQELLQAMTEENPIEKYSKLDKMMNEDVNLDYISKFVIGKYAKLMNKEQQIRYSNLFHRYALSLYKQINLKFDMSGIDFSIDDIIEHPHFTTVMCSVDVSKALKELEADKIPVKFKLIRGAENRIQAVDVEISEVSLVIEYRKQFYQMIKEEEEDINWFLDRFDDKVKANEKSFQTRAGI